MKKLDVFYFVGYFIVPAAVAASIIYSIVLIISNFL